MNKKKDILSKQVISSNIKQVDFDPFMNTMTVAFSNNTIYEYYGVPVELFEELTEAKSVGKLFQKKIKNNFDFAKRGKLVNHSPEESETE